jgi:hypothetical protein
VGTCAEEARVFDGSGEFVAIIIAIRRPQAEPVHIYRILLHLDQQRVFPLHTVLAAADLDVDTALWELTASVCVPDSSIFCLSRHLRRIGDF